MGKSSHLAGKAFLSWGTAILVYQTGADILIRGDSRLCWTSDLLRPLG